MPSGSLRTSAYVWAAGTYASVPPAETAICAARAPLARYIFDNGNRTSDLAPRCIEWHCQQRRLPAQNEMPARGIAGARCLDQAIGPPPARQVERVDPVCPR